MFKKIIVSDQKMLGHPISAWKRDIVIVIVLQFALGLIYLKAVPRLYGDDVWDSSLGYSLAHCGKLRHQFIEGFGGMHIHFVQPRLVLPLVCAAIFKVCGYSIVSARFGSVIFGVLTIVSLYAVTRRWFGEKQAFCIVVATILHPWFFEISRRTRPEIYCIALVMAALLCITYSLDSNSRRTGLFAGAFAGMAGLAHPLGITLDIAVVAAVLIWLRNIKIWRLVLWAFLGFVVVILPYIVYVLWSIQDPGVHFFEQMHSGWGQGEGGMFMSVEISRWKNFLQWPKGIPLAIIMIASWLLAWYRSTTADKILATIIGFFCLMLPFVSTNYCGRYLSVLIPFFCALMVRLSWRIITDHGLPLHNWYKFRFFFSMSIVVTYVLMSIMAISIMFYYLRGADFTKVLDRIASVVDRKDRIYGEAILWMGHDRYHYGPFPIDSSAFPFQQTVDMVRKYHFDYAVRSAWIFDSSYGVALPPADMPDFRPYYTIDQVCKQFGTKVYEFRDPYFGPFEIYKLNWDNDSNAESKK